MKNRFLIGMVFLLLFSTYQIQDGFNIGPILNIKKITIINNLIIDREKIKKELDFLYNTNLFFLKSKNIKKSLSKIDFIESFEIRKIYPSSIEIKIFEKKPIAIIQDKRRKFYFTSKKDTIAFIDLIQFKNLPIVFGDQESFRIFFGKLENIDFPINIIKRFYLFESKRWDIQTIDNKKIKLPIEKFEESLKNFLEIKNKENFEKYNIFDYRINDQLILK